MKAPADFYDYCRAHGGYFFNWESINGDLAAIANGRTVCYVEQLAELLMLSFDDGAPPVGTLLLTMIATDAAGNTMLQETKEAFVKALRRPKPDLTEAQEKEELGAAFAFLSKLSQVPADYRQGTLRKQLLMSVFHAAHNLISKRRLKRFVAEYNDRAFQPERLLALGLLNMGILRADLRPLEILNSKYPDTESILKAVADVPIPKGLPLKLEAPLSEKGEPKDFIEELEQRADTFYVGALIRRIWSGLAIPFHSHLPSVQPLGGVSDLSNKGELDKLLISEYANEEMLFLLRLANGEALFINRETPPETDRLQRILLIDSSLQTWGTPRTLAFALLIAIARHPKTDMECVAFSVGDKYVPIEFGNTDEVIAGLQTLATSANAADGLEQYLKAIAATKSKGEVIFITSPEGYRQAPVQRVIHERIAALSYCITADERGAVQVFKRRGNALSPLSGFTLPLKELWAAPPASAAKKESATEEQVASPTHYPILLPTPANSKTVFVTAGDGQVFGITSERAVLRRWSNAGKATWKGWAYVRDGLPPGNCHYEIGQSADRDYLLLCYVVAKHEIHLYNLTTSTHAVTHLDSYITKVRMPQFYFWDDGFVIIDGLVGWKFSLGKSSERHEAPSIKLTKLDAVADKLEERRAEWVRRRRLIGHDIERGLSNVSGTLLKNIREVGISAAGHLMLNQRELKGGADNQNIKFSSGAGQIIIPARPAARNRWVFPNDSSLTIDRNGMLILESADANIPIIYIPSVLDIATGAATTDFYAGTDFFDPVSNDTQERLKPAEFYKRFIAPFTQQIMQHAATA